LINQRNKARKNTLSTGHFFR